MSPLKSIVTGASGFVGSKVVEQLVKAGFDVLAIGRKTKNNLPFNRERMLEGSLYYSGDIDDINKLKKFAIDSKFLGSNLASVIHLAWWGRTKVSDLDYYAQYHNVTRAIKLYELANELKAAKFIFCGTMEESFAKAYTNMDYKKDKKYNRHVIYSLAKTASRNALKLSYSEGRPKPIFTSNSHVIGPGDEKDSFLQVTLKKMINKQDILMTSGEQNFDTIHVDDCARAYVAITKSGKGGASYCVGSGNPKKLKEYVLEMDSVFPGSTIKFGAVELNDEILPLETFCTNQLKEDTGFEASISFTDSIKELSRTLQ